MYKRTCTTFTTREGHLDFSRIADGHKPDYKAVICRCAIKLYPHCFLKFIMTLNTFGDRHACRIVNVQWWDKIRIISLSLS